MITYPTTSVLSAAADSDNCEVFYADAKEARENRREARRLGAQRRLEFTCCVGWYYRQCFPGCLPEGDALGPFTSYRAALRDAYESGYLPSLDSAV